MYTLPLIIERHRKTLQILDIEGVLLHHISDVLNSVLKTKFRRTIYWKENGERQTNLLHTYPFAPLKEIIHSKNNYYLLNDLVKPDRLRPHVYQVSWLLALWEERHQDTPPYAPKTLTSGLKVDLLEDNLVVSYQTVMRQMWSITFHNPVTVIPLTEANFKSVLNFHLDTAFQDWREVRDRSEYRPL